MKQLGMIVAIIIGLGINIGACILAFKLTVYALKAIWG